MIGLEPRAPERDPIFKSQAILFTAKKSELSKKNCENYFRTRGSRWKILGMLPWKKIVSFYAWKLLTLDEKTINLLKFIAAFLCWKLFNYWPLTKKSIQAFVLLWQMLFVRIKCQRIFCCKIHLTNWFV